MASGALHRLRGRGLLQVEVEVTERAGHDEAVGAGIGGVAEMDPRLAQRRLAVHRDDREAAALVDAGVVGHGSAQRLDHLMKVAIARPVLGDVEAVAGAHDVAAVERPDLQPGRGLRTRLRSSSSPRSSTSTQSRFLLTIPFS